MNILILTYEGGVAGSTNSISYLAKGLAEKGHCVYVGCRKDSVLYTLLSETKVNLVPMEFRGRCDMKNIRHIKDVVKEHDIQLINAQSSYDRYTSIFAKWLYKLNVRMVHTRRQVPRSMGGFFQNTLYVKGTDKMVAVSQGIKNELVKIGLPSKHIEVIYNGTPKEKYEKIDPSFVRELKNKFEIVDGDFVVGCVSRPKSQIQIIEALKFVKKPLKMIFVGLGSNDHFDKIINSYPVPHKVYFTGTVDVSKSLNYYKIFTIKVLASTMEGLSQSLLEAMAMGVPVIATDAAGNPDLVKNGTNGFLYENNNVTELAEKIDLLREDPSLREKFSINGKTTALEDFSIKKTVDNYEKFFGKLIEIQD